jgi:monoamine oxidase
MWTITRKYGVTNHLPFPLRASTHGHENNGHRDYKRPLLNGKLYISVQRPPANPGYMEGR